MKRATQHKEMLAAYVAYFRRLHIAYLERVASFIVLDSTVAKIAAKLRKTLRPKEDNKSAASV